MILCVKKTFVIVVLDLFHYVIFKPTLLFCLASYSLLVILFLLVLDFIDTSFVSLHYNYMKCHYIKIII